MKRDKTLPSIDRRCPFCGAVPEVRPHEMPDLITVGCHNSDCLVMPITAGLPEAVAHEAWNTRIASLSARVIERLVASGVLTEEQVRAARQEILSTPER